MTVVWKSFPYLFDTLAPGTECFVLYIELSRMIQQEASLEPGGVLDD